MMQYIKRELFREYFDNLRHYSKLLFSGGWNDGKCFYRSMLFEDSDGKKTEVIMLNGEIVSIETEEM